MSHRPSGSRRTGVASLATLAAAAALSVATPAVLTGTAQASEGHRGASSFVSGVNRGLHPTVGTSVSQPDVATSPVDGTVYIADMEGNQVVAVAPDGTQTTVGSELSSPHGVIVDSVGNVYVADSGNNRVVEVTTDGTQTTVPATGLTYPIGIDVDADGNLFIGDNLNSRVVELAPDGTQTTLPFDGGLVYPNGLTIDDQGDVFTTSFGNGQVLELTPDGTQTTVGSGLSCPTGLSLDAAGDAFIADPCAGRVVEVAADGTQTTVPTSGLGAPIDTAVDAAGNLYVVDLTGGGTVKVAPDGTQTPVAGVGGYGVDVFDSALAAAQTVSFTSDAPTGAVPGDDYTVSATGGDSGNPVTFSTQSGSVCTVDDQGDGSADVSLDHTGDCVIDADQTGSKGYAPADQAHQTVSVGQLVQSIAFTSAAPGDALPGDDYTVSASGGDSGNPVTFSTQSGGVCTVDDQGDGSADVSLDHAGECVIDADQLGAGDYAAAEQSHQKVTVGQLAQQVTFTSAPGTVRTGDHYTATATGGDSGNPVTFAVAPESAGSCTVSPTGQVHFLHAKPCSVVASQAGDLDYADASTVQRVHVLRAPQVVRFTSKAPRHATVGATYHAAATGNPVGRPVRLSVIGPCSIDRHGLVRFTHRGTCSVYARQAGTADYKSGHAKQVITVTSAGHGRGAVHLGTALLG